MKRDFAAYLFTLFCPLFTSGASFSIAREYSVRNLNYGLMWMVWTGTLKTREMENGGPWKVRGWKTRDWKTRDQIFTGRKGGTTVYGTRNR